MIEKGVNQLKQQTETCCCNQLKTEQA